MSPGRIQAVIFDWGGTLTPWHNIDFAAEARALARAVVTVPAQAQPLEDLVGALMEANQTVWARSRDHQQSSTIADIFSTAGLTHDPSLLGDYYSFWEPHTHTDPAVQPLFQTLRQRGIKVGVLSNTLWPRAVHVGYFQRDGVAHLIDGDVYTSEIEYTKPATQAFRAAMAAVGATDPSFCVYVGDRLFDDVWGAQNAGLRAIYLPHSDIPSEQLGHSVGLPDATVGSLTDIGEVVRLWS